MADDPSRQDWLIAALLRQIGQHSPSAFQIPGTPTAADVPGRRMPLPPYQIPGTGNAPPMPGRPFSMPADFGRMAGPQAGGAAMPPPPLSSPAANAMGGGALGGGVMGALRGPADFARMAALQSQGAAQPPTAPPEQVMPPVTAAAAPLPAAAPAPPQAAQAQGLDMSGYASLAVPQSQGAPGMSQVPQTQQQLDDWRKLMDAMQFARQGQ